MPNIFLFFNIYLKLNEVWFWAIGWKNKHKCVTISINTMMIWLIKLIKSILLYLQKPWVCTHVSAALGFLSIPHFSIPQSLINKQMINMNKMIETWTFFYSFYEVMLHYICYLISWPLTSLHCSIWSWFPHYENAKSTVPVRTQVFAK